MGKNGPRACGPRAAGFNSRGPMLPRDFHDIFFKCDVCNKRSASHRPCRWDTYATQSLAGNYHLGQAGWPERVIMSGQTFAFDKEGRKHTLTFLPRDKPHYVLRSNLLRWRYQMFGSRNRIKDLSRSSIYTFSLADQAHWHQEVDRSIPDPVARRNVVTLKDTQGGVHEVFIYKPTPVDEEEARKKWRPVMKGICETIFGQTVAEAEVPLPRYLWAQPDEEVVSPSSGDGQPSVEDGQAFRLDLPQSARARTRLSDH